VKAFYLWFLLNVSTDTLPNHTRFAVLFSIISSVHSRSWKCCLR